MPLRTCSSVTRPRPSRGRAAKTANASETSEPPISTTTGSKLQETSPSRVTIAIMTEMMTPLMLISMLALLSASSLKAMWFW